MNQVFDLNRWLLLTGKHWAENRKKYLLSLVAILALLVIWYSLVLLIVQENTYPPEMQISTYYIGMALAGCLFGSLLFAEMAGGPRAMHYLSVPASALEKMLTGLLYGVVLFFICYTAIFYLVDFIMVHLSNSLQASYWNDRDPQRPDMVYKVVNVFYLDPGITNQPEVVLYFLLIYFNLQAAFILGSIYFPGYSFIKTCIALLALFLFFVFLYANVLNSLMPAGYFYNGLFNYRVLDEASDVVKGVKLPDAVAAILRFLFMYGFIPLFWFATYHRLKEKEV